MNNFFNNSEYLDRMVLKPLSHLSINWELRWNKEMMKYETEGDSLVDDLNNLIEEIGNINPPQSYHDNEDALAEYLREKMNWNIQKVGNRWNCHDYGRLLEQGGFGDINESHLVKASAGRIKAAINFGQLNFDEMEAGHQKILSFALSSIIYHRVTNNPEKIDGLI